MDGLGYVFATKKIADEKLPVRFMYREKPDNKQDSGWRFFSGTETQEYTDDADNIKIISVKEIIKIDKSVEPYLNEEYGTAFERKDNNSEFTRIADFSFDTDNGEV